ncbi:hypothetical protein B0H13DRAFT_1865976 [Mycena leptocephala]|nr:hypothetical protein B0H13DRAFT_1865976 [Mycena leptocephala]
MEFVRDGQNRSPRVTRSRLAAFDRKAEIPEVKHSQRETLSSSLKHALCPQAEIAAARQIPDPDLDPDAPSCIGTRVTLRPPASGAYPRLRAACVREPETPRMTLRAQPAVDTGDSGARPARPLTSCMSPTTDTPMATNGNRSSCSVKLASVEHAMQDADAVWHHRPLIRGGSCTRAAGWDTAEKDARRAGNLVESNKWWVTFQHIEHLSQLAPPSSFLLQGLYPLLPLRTLSPKPLKSWAVALPRELRFDSMVRITSRWSQLYELNPSSNPRSVLTHDPSHKRGISFDSDITHGPNPLDKCGEAQIAVPATVEQYYPTLSSVPP